MSPELKKASALLATLPQHEEYKDKWADKCKAAQQLLDKHFPTSEYTVTVNPHKRKGVAQGYFYNVVKVDTNILAVIE